MSIVDWFDPHNREHLEAWIHLEEQGVWPEGFIPKEVTFGPTWVVEIGIKMAHCWISHALAAHI